ncbi:16S rRNA (guanine(966)-N(2))-methyltransferase RsmD [Serpentinimonas maccroryi]|uniref:16S rRNA (guanine(966)-N(2))-methyltransferase RsmD n=1 Tax=Serpentinimonas maccroryi TaxID=1458426 RepID=UPI0020333333|nr:16S rRNA (guanine(966)-N(2))-methyltransferase RsmD [Serpentinimonas maccroryi]MCM2478352.1 16S rRNA (guanine(966)-N(2))-methyltransferase RsmD [Serpentinimonas maccroryi]
MRRRELAEPVPAQGVPRPSRAPQPARPLGTVRLIGGLYKRSKLQVPDRLGLRPTPDRVRETLFNWLGQDLRGLRCLDAFAGTGALGLEAASRGATAVCLLERDPALVQALRAHVQRLSAAQVQVQQADALAWMRSAAPGAWDVVFLDPPFAATAEAVQAALSAARPLLPAGGLIYLEAPLPWSEAMLQPLGLQVQRHGRAGQVHYHLLGLV